VDTLHKGENDNNSNNNTFNSRRHFSCHKIVLPYLPSVTKAEKKSEGFSSI
jgi:hypothetical protein